MRHQQLVFSIVHRYERDPQRMEDLAQETFIRVWKHLEGFDGRSPLAHWISKIALRVSLDHLRRRKRLRAETAFDDLGDAALEWLRDPGEEKQLDARDAAELLGRAMEALSPEDRQVITLLELEGRSVKEICELTGHSSVSVRVRAYRARGRLKKVLEEIEGSGGGTSGFLI